MWGASGSCWRGATHGYEPQSKLWNPIPQQALLSCNVVFPIFPIYTTFQSVINNKWLNFFLEFQIKIKDKEKQFSAF